MPEIVHGAGEAEPVLLLVGREVQLGLDPLDIGIAVGDDLVGRQLRCAGLGQDRDVLILGIRRRVLGLLARLGALAGFRALLGALGILVLGGARLLGVLRILR
jgi:hypothetical protein